MIQRWHMLTRTNGDGQSDYSDMYAVRTGEYVKFKDHETLLNLAGRVAMAGLRLAKDGSADARQALLAAYAEYAAAAGAPARRSPPFPRPPSHKIPCSMAALTPTSAVITRGCASSYITRSLVKRAAQPHVDALKSATAMKDRPA
jgi:hypothetical protein